MARKRKLSDSELKKKRKQNMIQSCIIIDIIILYFCMLIGHGIVTNSGENGITVISNIVNNFPMNFYKIFPTSIALVLGGIVVAALIDVVMYDSYLKKKDIVENPNGDAAFEEDFKTFNKEFVIDPTIVEKVTGQKPKTYFTEEHKKVVISPKIKNKLEDKIYRACWFGSQLYADKVALSLNGSWVQRNSNAIIFGASGAGKSRFFLNPNLLQANSNYVVTDPSAEIMLGYGAFLREQGYIVKCLNISDMKHSCRFNPLYYIKDPSDIPVIVTTLMENTQKKQGSGGGDGDFWQKTTQALLCAIIGYLYEVEPLERRNFYNVLEMLRMAQEDEDGQDQEQTDFDKMFEVLGKKNPNSYAFHQYQTYSLAPRKTALNILISTAVLLSTFIDIPEFNNLTYKDEMELDKFGAAPYKLKDDAKLYPEDEEKYKERYESKKLPEGYIDVEDFKKYEEFIEKDDMGRYKEGNPYKMAIFLCIPTADTTYNWLTAMMYSMLFKLTYRRGETRAKEQILTNPKLAFPARFLIDECANIGKIPNLQEYLATCRKYCISIVPIFQSFSQIQKVYGKEDANSIYANCDTTLFLGGVDSDTLKIVCDRLGKESVKALTTGTSGGGRGKSNSTNVQNIGRELMSRIQVEQMSNAECIVFIRALKPFKVKKFNLNGHPNYKYTAEANPKKYSFINPFSCEYNDFEIESIRIKKVGEKGYSEPEEINSARLIAVKQQMTKDRREKTLSLQRSASQYGTFDKSLYDNEKDEKTAERNHLLYVEELNKTYIEAQNDNDVFSMDVIKGICKRYNIDINIDFDFESNEDIPDSRSRSAGSINKLSQDEAIQTMKNASLGAFIVSGPSSEFDIPTLEQIVKDLGHMVKDSDGHSILEKVRKETEKISSVEKKEYKITPKNENKKSEELNSLKEDDDISTSIKKEEIPKEQEKILYIEEDTSQEEKPVNNETTKTTDEEINLETEGIPPTEEELEQEINNKIDFSKINESESLMDTYDDSYNDDFYEDSDNQNIVVSSEEVLKSVSTLYEEKTVNENFTEKIENNNIETLKQVNQDNLQNENEDIQNNFKRNSNFMVNLDDDEEDDDFNF